MNYSYLVSGEYIFYNIETFKPDDQQKIQKAQIIESQQKIQKAQTIIIQAQQKNNQLAIEQKKQVDNKKNIDKQIAKVDVDLKIQQPQNTTDNEESTYSKFKKIINDFYQLFDDKYIENKQKEYNEHETKHQNNIKQYNINLQKEQIEKQKKWDTEHQIAQNIANIQIKQAETTTATQNAQIQIEQQKEKQKELQKTVQLDAQRKKTQIAEAKQLAQKQAENDAQRMADARKNAVEQQNMNAQTNELLLTQKQYNEFIAQQTQIIDNSNKVLDKQLLDKITLLTKQYNNAASSLNSEMRNNDGGVRQRARDRLNNAMQYLQDQTNKTRITITNNKQNIIKNLNIWKQQFNNGGAQKINAINAQNKEFQNWPK